jgi:hypothetical protein
MSAFEEHRDELEHYEQMFGRQRGRLAVALDLVTNALLLAGQHAVYCHTSFGPGHPKKDVEMIGGELDKAKELIQSVMEEIRTSGERRA